jgi:hypothetical protein
LTYREFDEKLKKHGLYLGNEDRGFIDVLKDTPKSLFQKSKTIKIIQIGFFGWHRQVNMKAVKSVLRAAGLVGENGVDSHVFFQGGDPFYKLMDDFHGPLLRLKDR